LTLWPQETEWLRTITHCATLRFYLPDRVKVTEPLYHSWLNDPTVRIFVASGQRGLFKGVLDLINAVYTVFQKHPIWMLIFGVGPQRKELKALIDRLGLTEIIKIQGHVVNPLKYFAYDRAFVLSLLFEGIPNVLMEPTRADCTHVTTACPTSPREIRESGRHGYRVLVQDPKALATGTKSALRNPVSVEVLEEAIKPFHDEAVVAEHSRLLGI